jgi:hypothetical protein
MKNDCEWHEGQLPGKARGAGDYQKPHAQRGEGRL